MFQFGTISHCKALQMLKYGVIIIGITIFLLLNVMSFLAPNPEFYWKMLANMELLLFVCIVTYLVSQVGNEGL
jgi:hypothetical protein